MEYKIFFNWLLSTSIKGSFLVCVIFFIKLLFRNKMGARWHYYIWFLLVISLLIPFAPKSTISIFNLFDFNEPTDIMTKNIMKYNSYTVIKWFGKESSDIYGISAKNKVILGSSVNFLMMIWLIGVILTTFYIMRINVNLYLSIKKEDVYDEKEILMLVEMCKRKMGIYKKLSLIKTQTVMSPSLFGFFRPCLLLPMDIEKKLSTSELRYVILHELAHVKRKDIAKLWIITVLQIVHWFNPVIWYGFYQMRQDCEVACDALVLFYISDEEHISYGQTIIHLLENMRKPFQATGMAGILGSKSQIKRRIKMITLFKKNKYKLSLISMITFLLVGCIFLTSAKERNIVSQINESNQGQVDIAMEKSSEVYAEKINSQDRKEIFWPIPDSSTITMPYGKRKHPILKKEKMHTGIDIEADEGMSIIAAADGTIVQAGELGGYGNAIIIDHGDGFATLYGHCSEMLVKENSTVKAGDEIAKVGDTGLGTGPNLHFEVRKDGEAVDPEAYMN